MSVSFPCIYTLDNRTILIRLGLWQKLQLKMIRQLYSWLLMGILFVVFDFASSIKQKHPILQNVVSHISLLDHSIKEINQKIARIKTANPIEDGLSAPRIETKFTDCSSMYEDGFTESGVYNIWLTTGYKFLPIYCDMETRHPDTNKRGWMVIQRRYNGELNFNRTWQEYVDGFGSPHGEYWIGLENIYQLAKYTEKLFDERSLLIELTDHSGVHVQARYAKFEIFNSTLNYKLASPYYMTTSASLRDGLTTSQWEQFTTYDRNNQNIKTMGNCAQTSGGGWWLDFSCSWSNLNARYPKKNEKMSKSTIYWKAWDDINPRNAALTNVSMKIQ